MSMLRAEAEVSTQRASRYLVQLCEHLAQIGGHGNRGAHDGAPPVVERVQWTEDHGVIAFPFGRCTLTARQDGLTLIVEAADDASLELMKAMFAMRLETIGRRDQLEVRWSTAAP
jgi:hypothetical protein